MYRAWSCWNIKYSPFCVISVGRPTRQHSYNIHRTFTIYFFSYRDDNKCSPIKRTQDIFSTRQKTSVNWSQQKFFFVFATIKNKLYVRVIFIPLLVSPSNNSAPLWCMTGGGVGTSLELFTFSFSFTALVCVCIEYW